MDTNPNAPQFTPEQLRAFIAYEAVRRRGNWNMFDPRARQATGLSRIDYLFVMEHYSDLKAAQAAGSES